MRIASVEKLNERSIYRTAVIRERGRNGERQRESQCAALLSKLGLAKKKKGEKKESERTRGEQRAGKQAGQSLAHPTKKLTPEKLTHQRATKDERETKQRCVVLASLRPSTPPRPLPPCPPATPSLLENKKRVKNLPKKINYFPRKTRPRSTVGRGQGGTRCRGQGRPGKGQRGTKSHQETDSSKLIVSDNSRWHTKKDCTKEISGSSFEKRETTRSGREKKSERGGGGGQIRKRGRKTIEGNCKKKEGDKDGAHNKFSRPACVEARVAASR